MSWLSRLLDDNEKWAEGVMKKAKEDTERQQREYEEREEERRHWLKDNRSSHVPRSWELLTGDKGNNQSYYDGNEVHHVHPDGTPLVGQELEQYLDDHYGYVKVYDV